MRRILIALACVLFASPAWAVNYTVYLAWVYGSDTTHCTLSPGLNQSVASGSSATFTLTPNSGYKVKAWIAPDTMFPRGHISISRNADSGTVTIVMDNVTQNGQITAGGGDAWIGCGAINDIFVDNTTASSLTDTSGNGSLATPFKTLYGLYTVYTTMGGGSADFTGVSVYIRATSTDYAGPVSIGNGASLYADWTGVQRIRNPLVSATIDGWWPYTGWTLNSGSVYKIDYVYGSTGLPGIMSTFTNVFTYSDLPNIMLNYASNLGIALPVGMPGVWFKSGSVLTSLSLASSLANIQVNQFWLADINGSHGTLYIWLPGNVNPSTGTVYVSDYHFELWTGMDAYGGIFQHGIFGHENTGCQNLISSGQQYTNNFIGFLMNSDHSTISNMESYNNTYGAVPFLDPDAVILNSIFANNTLDGILLAGPGGWSVYGTGSSLILGNSVLINNGGNGINDISANTSYVFPITLSNDVFDRNKGQDIYISPASTDYTLSSTNSTYRTYGGRWTKSATDTILPSGGVYSSFGGWRF